jgi:hypothetical protein
MNSFSFNRFGKVLRWLISINRVQLLGLFAGCAVAMFMIEMAMIGWGGFHAPWPFIVRAADIMTFFFVLILMVLVSLAFASITSLGKKTQRSAFLMLPASNLEKFLAVVVYVTFVCTFCAYSAIILGDTLRMGAMWFFGGPVETSCPEYPLFDDDCSWWSSVLPRLLFNVTPHFLLSDRFQYTTLYLVMNILVITAVWVWIHSLFILGATSLRKYSFVVSGLVLILCVWGLAYMIHTYHLSMFTSGWEGDHYVSQEVGTMAYALAVVLPLLSVFNYWVSYRIFKGFQLITNKWTNYDFHKR